MSLANSQPVDPTTWTAKSQVINQTERMIILECEIEPKWHLYTLQSDKMNKLNISFTQTDDFSLVGSLSESPTPKKKHDEYLKVDVRYISGKVVFKQRIKAIAQKNFVIKGTIQGQACMDDGMCTLVSSDFEVEIKGATEKPKEENTNDKNKHQDNKKKNEIDTSSNTNDTENEADITDSDTSEKNVITPPYPIDTTLKDKYTEKNVNETNQENTADSSLMFLFWFSFLAGLAAIFTPCVFPMIPMTVTFFMHNNENKRKAKFQALFYGISIIAIYTIIGTIVAIAFGAHFANWLSTHWLPNILFFIIFMIFAASFLGMFEITLPSWIVNKADQQADKGGALGPFFMAFTLVVVSFSCTGPLVGAILVESAGGAVLEPIIGMLGFSVAFALPFTLFALFPSWLSKLPKSGGWLNSVKVVLGFIELALGLKFLSMADLTYHWGLLDREIYLAFWIVIFTMLGFYLLGKLKFSHDSDLDHISVPRLSLAIVTFAFVVYMIPGLFGAPLKALSGYIPPASTHDFDIHQVVRDNSGREANIDEVPKYDDFLYLPHGLKGYFDYEQGMRVAKKLNKPVFIDFTGHGCANCRKMEEMVWADPQVLKRLRENFVIIALYVDDKTTLPENEWIKKDNGKIIKTLGGKNADFQATVFNVNAQPYYVLLNNEGKELLKPQGFTTNINKFIEFLDKGVEQFKKR